MMRRALLVASPGTALAACGGTVLEGVHEDVAMVAALLHAHGFDPDICAGKAATRAGILERLDRLIADTRAGDAVVVYYTGHGGQVPNTACIPDLAVPGRTPRHHQFIVPDDFSCTGAFRGILSIELAHALARLTERTRNVSVVMDCCHSGGIMRAPPGLIAKALPAKLASKNTKHYNEQIRRHLEQLGAKLGSGAAPVLDPESNRWAVRLEAARSDQRAYMMTLDGKPCSALTRAFTEAVAAHRGPPMTWDALIAPIRERVRRYTENDQRPGIAGPVHRRLFQLEEAAAPGAAAAAPGAGAPAVHDLHSGAGPHALDTPFALRWGRARHGRHLDAEPAGHAAEINEGEAIWVEIANLAIPRRATLEATRIFCTALHVDMDGTVALLTSSEPSGVRLQAGERYTLGYRAHGGLGELRMTWPAHLPRTGRARRSVVAIAADRPHELRALDLGALEAGSPNIRYAVRRLELSVVPARSR